MLLVTDAEAVLLSRGAVGVGWRWMVLDDVEVLVIVAATTETWAANPWLFWARTIFAMLGSSRYASEYHSFGSIPDG